MVSPLLLLPFLCGIVIDQEDPDTCDLLVRVEEQSGRPAPPDLWVRAQFVGGASVAAPLEAGVAALRTRCGLHRVEVGSPAADPGEMASPRTELRVHPLAEDAAVTRLDRVTELWLHLPPSAEARLEVVGPRRNALAGFQLDARPADHRPGVSLVTGKDGRARFRGRLGPYDLYWREDDVRSVRLDGRESRQAPVEPLRARLTADGLTVSIVMDDVGPGTGAIRTCDGRALPGVEVRVERPSVAVMESASTDRRGEFRKALVRPPFTLRPRDRSGKWTFDPPAVACERVPCAASFTACPSGAGCLRLQVVSEGDGQAIEGVAFAARATCAEGAAEYVVSGLTDGRGRAALPCPHRCPLSLRVFKHTWLERSVEIPPGRCQDEHVLRLPRGTVVRGRIVDLLGRPAAALPVRVSLGEWVWSGPSLTDADGTFEVAGVPPGFQRVEVDGDGVLALARCVEEDCTAAGLVVGHEPMHSVELRLLEGGRICGAAKGGGRACLRVLSLEGLTDREALVSAIQGGWGEASVCSAPLPAGEYRVRLDCPGDPAALASWPVTVRAGEMVRLGPAP